MGLETWAIASMSATSCCGGDRPSLIPLKYRGLQLPNPSITLLRKLANDQAHRTQTTFATQPLNLTRSGAATGQTHGVFYCCE
ncbi:hypothetical protein H6F76_21005 [Leptolyngbya sp. FACHB-321]|nr:hypothetical protein [Leptolyngbya sp. FACHB-321]